MIDIQINKASIDLFPNTSIKFVLNNPIFNRELIEGSYSFPFKLPWTARNRKIFSFNEIVSNRRDFFTEVECETIIKGIPFFEGTIKVRNTGNGKYQANLIMSTLAISDIIKNKSLIDLTLGGPRAIPEGSGSGSGIPSDFINHAQDTITGTADDFDYVFFPIFNPNLYDEKNTDYKDHINYYNSGFLENSSSTMPFWEYTYSPFIYLVYVFKQLFEENNYSVKGKFWNDTEIKTLVIYNNRTLDELGSSPLKNIFSSDISLKQHVPDIKFIDFLVAIKNLFGLSYFFDHQKKIIEVIALKDIIKSDGDFIDWSNKISPKFDITQKKDEGIKVKYQHDDSDALAETRLGTKEILNILDPVEKESDLPAPGALNINDAVLVNSLNSYFRIIQDPTTGDHIWENYSENLYDFIIGNGKQAFKVDVSKLIMAAKQDTIISPRDWLIPEIRQKGSIDFFDIGFNKFGLSLLFYRGMQPSSGGNYPLGSYHNYNFDENTVGNYSLVFDGESGTYNVWWKPWFDFLTNAKIIKYKALLNILDIINIDFKKKYRIKGINHILKTVKVTFTMKEIKPAEIILYTIQNNS